MADDLQPYYAARAAEYDRIYAKPERQADLAALRAWLPPRFAGKRVLEVACGTGYWTQFIASSAASMVCIDAADETLQIARSRVTSAAVEFRVGDAYALPPNASAFDAAFAGFWWSHVPKARQAEFLRGLRECLEPGATVVMIDNEYVDGSSTPVSETDAEGNTYQTRRLDEGSSHRVLKNFPTADELRQSVEGFGTEVEVTTWPYFWAVSYRRI